MSINLRFCVNEEARVPNTEFSASYYYYYYYYYYHDFKGYVRDKLDKNSVKCIV